MVYLNWCKWHNFLYKLEIHFHLGNFQWGKKHKLSSQLSISAGKYLTQRNYLDRKGSIAAKNGAKDSFSNNCKNVQI